MNGIHRTSSQILDAFSEFGNDARFCSECKEFHFASDPSHYEHSRHSFEDLQVELEEAFIGEQKAMGEFITRIGLGATLGEGVLIRKTLLIDTPAARGAKVLAFHTVERLWETPAYDAPVTISVNGQR